MFEDGFESIRCLMQSMSVSSLCVKVQADAEYGHYAYTMCIFVD